MAVLKDDKSFSTYQTRSNERSSHFEEENEDTSHSGGSLTEEKATVNSIPDDDGAASTILFKKLAKELKTAVVNLFKFILIVVKYVVYVMLTLYVISMIATQNSTSAASPSRDLRSFVLSEKENIDKELSSIEELETDSFDAYSAAYCLEGVTLKKTRDALASGLKGVPPAVRNDIVDMALRDGISAKNTFKNSNADLVDKSKAYSYMAFYSTAYEHDRNGLERYKTCVMVTGVTFTVSEHVAAYTETEEEYQSGLNLDCGVFTCWNKPRYAKRIVRTPVLKRRSLSLKKQKELHDWMIHQAIESAGHLVAGELSADEAAGNMLPSGGATRSAWSWSPPEYADEL